MTHPNDADSQALANIADSGVDMSKPIPISFAIAVPNDDVGKAVYAVVAQNGYQAELYFDEGEPDYVLGDDEEFAPSWTVFAIRVAELSYDNVVQIQKNIDQLVSGLGGNCDGWEVRVP